MMWQFTTWLCVGALGFTGEEDRDGDGLSDFWETHKYRTDPERSDSDGDGVPDGDWFERREWTYVVRSIVQVMRPVTTEFLDGDFQDVRVLGETVDRVELEVLHFPFSTVAESLEADDDWRRTVRRDRALARWLEPGLTADGDAALGRAIETAISSDGLSLEGLDDRALVERASRWLLQRAESINCFTTFCTAFDDEGRPFIPEHLVEHVQDGTPPSATDWQRELSAKGMFEHRTRGSCSSSSIYLSGCLRALGIPTRTVLCIPLFDASDEREWAMVRDGIQQPFVRETILAGMKGLERSWASHSFNEVFVGGRWWRLDYTDLGVGNLRRERFGMMTHVATFHDWADARMPETIGRRQAHHTQDAILDGANPYSMLFVRDEVGAHSTLTLPKVQVQTGRITAFEWMDSDALPEDVRDNCERRQRFGLIARVEGVSGPDALGRLLDVADRRIYLEAEGQPRLSIGLDPGCWWFKETHAWVYVPFGPADRRDLAEGVAYQPVLRNDASEGQITCEDAVRVPPR